MDIYKITHNWFTLRLSLAGFVGQYNPFESNQMIKNATRFDQITPNFH